MYSETFFQGNLFTNNLNIVINGTKTLDIFSVVVWIPTTEFDYSGSVWNKERTIQSKVRTSTGVD